MVLKRCTFDELPAAMKMHVLYCEKIPVSEYRLAIWSNQDTLYYNDLKENEVKRFVALIESEKRHLDNRTMNSIYNKYGFAVYAEILDAHHYFLKKADEALAEKTVQEYMPIIEKAMERSSVPLSEPLLKAMNQAAAKGKFKYKEWSTAETYIYFMGYLLGSKKLKWKG
ncbi:MAG: hypothetical protein ACOYBL_06240 [Lachnospiraceae bacterium]|jgi:hypothetical protein